MGRHSKSRNKIFVGKPAEGSLESLVFCRDPRAQSWVREHLLGFPAALSLPRKRAGSKAWELSRSHPLSICSFCVEFWLR